ncbi:MAG TPA: DNA polymerase III subunit gamma/tau [Gammaproteobacteria bacterium]|nr:DNA polymerase III subunit gamma/tau [Gammaproteobacteria bacterium]
MSYQVLARKWRPRNFTELVGQDHVQRALVNALDNDRLHHAYLFTGTRGVGKTTIARIFAKALNCEEGVSSSPCGKCSACEEINEGRFIDLIEVDAASRTKVEDTRELLENVQYAPTRGRYKVYLIDEVHMLSGHSFNALLKTLEEPPPHVKFLLATTDPQRLPVTILSRCLQFNLKSLTLPQITGQIDTILEQEQVSSEEGAVRQLAFAANGSMRDALSLLDQAIAYGDGGLREDEVCTMLGTIDRDVIYRLLDALSQDDAALVLEEIGKADAFAPDYSSLLADVVSALQRIAIAQTLPDAIDDSFGDRDAVLALAGKLSTEDVQLYYQIGLIGRRDLPLSPEPRGGFEMVMLRMLAFRPAAWVPDAVPGRARSQAPQQSAGEPVVLKPSARPAVGTPAPADKAGGAGSGTSTGEWAGIIETLSLKGMAREMSLNCAFHGVDDDIVQLSLDPAHTHLLGKAREEQLEAALCEYYQRKVTVRITKEGKLESETPAGQRTREQHERQQQAEESILQDENVKAIQNAFGGSVNQDSIRPRD